MTEMTMARLQELMVVLYAVSLVFYFVDYLNRDKVAHRSAFWVLVVVYVMQTGFLIDYMIETKRFPVLSLFEGIYFYAWLIITLSIILHLFYKVGYAVFFLNAIGFVLITIHTFAPLQNEQSQVGEALISELLFIHITFAILSYTAFAMSFVSGVLYLLVYNILKKKKWSKQFSRLPSLQQTTTSMKASLLTGFPFLLISLILGVQWATVALDNWSFFDMKILGSFLILAVYGSVLFMQRSGKLIGNDFAWANIFTFLIVIINLFLGSRLSAFHFWI
ncbi:cytochrome c biogenesis protein CcsA [Filibacter tadaridae]|uniref:Cytochrome c biogenesis protein CcsA n=1 Tax=Filibacter tadaridae TaxID=2483811 RepID=A0A3P5XD63_9BACL|nr:cytochrome c biogenesis protein CcsA [Filibacter tadaridae]VDC32659.1 Cytochrome c biogenesis protein CcsA [Filibacter tadaridae]